MDNMMKTQSLAQIVNSNHKAAAVFEKYQLDFCCKGKRTLLEACRENAIVADDVLSDLETITTANSCTIGTNFQHFSLQQLADYIVNTHHSFTKKEMPAIHGYLTKVASKHGDRHPELIKVQELFGCLKDEMMHHMQKEELVLFPRIKEIEKSINSDERVVMNSLYLRSPIDVMENDHEHAGDIMKEIRILTHDFAPPSDACTTFRLAYASLHAFELDLHQHVHLENNILFPKALKMAGQGDRYSLN